MIVLRRLWSILRWLFRRTKAEQDLDADLQSFIALSTAEKVRDGMAPDDARRLAILEIGGTEQVKEQVRTRLHGAFLDESGRDLRYAFRIFGKNPVFTSVVILTLALGIGANTAIFSLMDALMLKSLPVRDPERLVELRMGRRQTFSYPVWQFIRDHQQFLDGELAYFVTGFNLASSGETHIVNGLFVSGSYFGVLGIQPVIGRLIMPDDDRRGCSESGPVAVLSYGFWQSQFGGAVNVIGQKIALGGRPHTIIGVSSPEFSGVRIGQSFEIAAPLCTNGTMVDEAGSSWLRLMGRLKPGETIAEAESGIRQLQPALRDATAPPGQPASLFKNYLKDPFQVLPAANGTSSLRNQYSQPVVVLMGIVGLVLLVACGNIASLLMARASARTREIAVRISIGASRYRLIRQLLVESLVLSAAGSVVGIFLARLSSRILVNQLSTSQERIFLDLGLDWRILAFATAAGILTGLLFGIVPAIRTTRWSSSETLREMTTGAGGSRNQLGAGRWLVAFQMGLSLVLIFAAALFLHSYWKLVTVDHGFSASNIVVVDAALRRPGITANNVNDDPTSLFQTYLQAFDAIRFLPGVETAAYSNTIPLGDNQMDSNIRVDGYQPQSDGDSDVYFNYISPGYFQTFETALIAGRDFDAHDSEKADAIAIVNETFARRFFSGRNPVGRVFSRHGPKDTWPSVEIVGLVKDASYTGLREPVPPTAYMPNSPRTAGTVFSIRSALPAAAITPEVIEALAAVDKNFSVTIGTLRTRVADATVRERLMALLSIFFGVLALIIAAIGLAGLVSYSVTRRRAEIGIRSALGATPASLVGLLMREVILLTIGGILFGVLLGIAGGRMVAAMLYQLTPGDPLTLIVAVGTLTAVALVAGYLPARNAARIDPMECLRSE